MAACEIWERAMIPSLLSGAGTWTGDIRDAVEIGDKMKWRIWQEKVFLLQRINKLEKGTLAKQIYTEGRELGLPGLWKEVSEICEEVDIPDINDFVVSKGTIRTAIFEHHYSFMMGEMEEKYKKLEDIKNEDFREVQEYIKNKSVYIGRMAFKIRTKMVSDIPANFKNKFRVKKGEDECLVCLYCDEGQLMDQAHCLQCVKWVDMREGLDLTNIEDLVNFFSQMLKEKTKIDKENKENKKGTQGVCTAPSK